MAIEWTRTVEQGVEKTLHVIDELAAGKSLSLELEECSPETYADTVPEGKKWMINAYIHILEVDE